MNRLLLLLAITLALVGCFDDRLSNLNAPRQFFAKNKIGSSADYGIVKFGNPDDHVITVHGFADDAASCKTVADALNADACKETGGEQCLRPYSCIALNQ